MSIALILAVGQDLLLLDTRSWILRAASYLVESALSPTQSINQFQTGDFDMVLLCHSIPLQERDRLACAIRSSGYRVPVVLVASVSQECSRGCADAILENHPKALVQGIERALRNAIGRQQREHASSGHFVNRAARHTILCIDVDPEGRLIRRRLLENAGYIVLTAQNGCDGLKIFSVGVADAVVLDYALPLMNGSAVADEMRRIDKNVPLILYSGSLEISQQVWHCSTESFPRALRLRRSLMRSRRSCRIQTWNSPQRRSSREEDYKLAP